MTIPDFQSIMLPLLRLATDKEIHKLNDAVDQLANQFDLSDEERSELLQSGQQPVFYNRVGWAKTYLKKSGLLEDPRRGHFQITERGSQLLRENPSKINMKLLERYDEYREFKKSDNETIESIKSEEYLEELTPEEALENAYQRIRKGISEQLLSYVINSTPGFFEKLVVELLVKMGYGGTQRDAARAVGRSGDEGIDGIIDEDRLGLETIYIQAKKWNTEQTVGRREIQQFVGALTGQRAKKGVFITTTRFTDTARHYVENIEPKVILIDGNRLTELMIDYGVGVASRTSYELKEIDTDYFGEAAADF